MKRVLIAFDGSPGAETALHDLRRAGLPRDTEARVVTIAEVWLPPSLQNADFTSADSESMAKYRKAQSALLDAKEAAVEGAQKVHAMFTHWNVSNAARADSPAWGILAEAKDWRADLVVVGSHGRNPLERFFLGSVSFKIAAEARCSVRVVRPPQQPKDHSGRLLAALDGSGDSRLAVEELLRRSWLGGTEVDLVTVLDADLKSRLQSGESGHENDALAATKQLLDESAEKLQKHGLVVRSHLLEGEPKNTILKSAADWKTDCIFLGARGQEHRERLYLGTVASAISTRAQCTVEIVRPEPK